MPPAVRKSAINLTTAISLALAATSTVIFRPCPLSKKTFRIDVVGMELGVAPLPAGPRRSAVAVGLPRQSPPAFRRQCDRLCNRKAIPIAAMVMHVIHQRQRETLADGQQVAWRVATSSFSRVKRLRTIAEPAAEAETHDLILVCRIVSHYIRTASAGVSASRHNGEQRVRTPR
jgi:hypothetical protein